MKAELTLTARPLRHVYFIAENDLAQFTETAAFCCTQWGGINNLIFPLDTTITVSADATAKERWICHLLRQRNPDIFVSALPANVRTCSIWQWFESQIAHDFPGKPVLTWEKFSQEDQSLHPLSVVPFKERIERVTITNAVFFAGETPSAFEMEARTAAFGKIWPGQEQDYAAAYDLHPFPLSAFPEAMLRAQLSADPYASIVNLTLKELANQASISLFPSLHFDVVVAQAVADLCRFWNLRAFAFGHHLLPDRRVLLLTKEQFLSERYFQPLLQLIRERRAYPPFLAEAIRERSVQGDLQAKLVRVNLDVIFHHQNDEATRQFLQSQHELRTLPGRVFSVTVDAQGAKSSVEIHDPDAMKVDRPIYYMEDLLEDVPIFHEYGGRRIDHLVELSEGSNSFLVPMAGPQTSLQGGVREGVQSALWQHYLAHASVARLIAPKASFEIIADQYDPLLTYPGKIRLAEMQRISVALPTTWEMYRAYFGSMGYDVFASDKMAYAAGFLEIAGGLEKAGILRSRTAYDILDFLAIRAAKKLARELIKQTKQEQPPSQEMEQNLVEAILESGLLPRFQRYPQTFQSIKSALKERSQQHECLAALSELVKIKAVQRGWNVVCPHCQTTIWYGLGALDEQIKCQGCLRIFDVPLKETTEANSDRSLQYSLNPLADRAMDQDIIPVLVALLTLRERHQDMAHVIPGMAYKRSGTKNSAGDFDFAYVYRHRLYGGECKAGSLLGEKDIQVARLARQLGFRAYFFVTIGDFSEQSKRLIHFFQQELVGEVTSDPPFAVFALERQELFEGEPLSDDIPQ